VSAKWLSSLVATLLTGLLATGCGGGNGGSTASNPTSVKTSPRTAKQAGAETGVPAEAQAAATGDIPDNQAFLTYEDRAAGYSIRYPEGWARKGSGTDVTFQDRANVIHVVVAKGKPPTPAGAIAGLEKLKRGDPSVKASSAQAVTLGGSPVVKVTYTRLSAPDPVTGKRLPLTIDRYEYSRGGKVAIVDLGTPVGVDNVDAYRMISESFQWR
jgi:PsbP